MSEGGTREDRPPAAGSWIGTLENRIIGSAIIALVLLSSWQIIRRALFNDAWIYADGLIRQSVLWLAVLGALAATGQRKHIAIELDPKADQRPWAALKARAVNLIAAAFCGALAWYGWQLVLLEQDGGSELMPGLPLWWSLLIVPAGFGLMALRLSWYVVKPGGGASK